MEMNRYGIGIDVGGTFVKFGLFKTDGTLIDQWKITSRKEDIESYILDDIVQEINKKIEEKDILKTEVIGIGLGVPGPVLQDGIVVKCVNIGWDVFNVQNVLCKKSGLKVKVGNDANLAALGELWQGNAKGLDSIVLVTLGTGVGSGIIINGKMLFGNHGAGGEIGHMQVNEYEEEYCACGGKGCLDQYASATGIVRIAKQYLTSTDTPSSLRTADILTSKIVFDQAQQGDKVANLVINNFGEILGRTLAKVSCVCDPEAFVIGGGVSKAGEILLRVVEHYYNLYVFHAMKSKTKFLLSKLGDNAGIYGGAKLIIDDVVDK
jgi:ROK family protein (putative glucokinase)